MNDPTDEFDDRYLRGVENKAIRYYYYLNQGLGILNNFRNLVLGILALYIALHLDNPLFLVLMFIPSVVALTILGYYNVHTMNKVMEWIGIRFSSHYAIRQFNYQQGIHEELVRLNDAMMKRYETPQTPSDGKRDSPTP